MVATGAILKVRSIPQSIHYMDLLMGTSSENLKPTPDSFALDEKHPQKKKASDPSCISVETQDIFTPYQLRLKPVTEVHVCR